MTHFFPALWISQRKRRVWGGFEVRKRRKRGKGEESSRASHITRESFTPQTASWHPRLFSPSSSSMHTTCTHTANQPCRDLNCHSFEIMFPHHKKHKTTASKQTKKIWVKEGFLTSLSSCQPESKHTEFGSRPQSRPSTLVSYNPHLFYWW